MELSDRRLLASMRSAPRGTGMQGNRKRLIHASLSLSAVTIASAALWWTPATRSVTRRASVTCRLLGIRSVRALPGFSALQERSRRHGNGIRPSNPRSRR